MDTISSKERCISLGPWGGADGHDFTSKVDGPKIEITVWHGDVIDAIEINPKSGDHVMGSSGKFGGGGGGPDTFCIDSSVEQISSIILTYKDYYGRTVITSLCFITNLNQYGPFGKGGGDSVSIPIQGALIAGFHGRSCGGGGEFINAIGVFLAPKDSNNYKERCISIGPWGGADGADFIYEADGQKIEITVWHGDVIDAIAIKSMGSFGKFGGEGGGPDKFCIDSSVEQISSIILTYQDYYGRTVVTSLCFITNLNQYGPFGKGGGDSVSIPIQGALIVGFHGRGGGRGGDFINAIGVFLAPKENPALDG